MVRTKKEVDVIICDFCGYQKFDSFPSFLMVDKCIKCGKDFCPKCGEFEKDGNFVCNECNNE